MRYTNIPKDKRNDVITIHTVETTEKVTTYYEVVGLNKMQAKEAANYGRYLSSAEHKKSHLCKNINQIPKHTLDANHRYVATSVPAWVRDNPLCRSCRQKIKYDYTVMPEVVE